MTLLALDTSTSFASIALVREETTLAEMSWQVGQRHSTELLQRISWLLEAHGVAPAALTGVAVALGPGSFNGIRVAVATAKSLAFALRVPLVGVPTLDCIGWGAHLAERPIWALLEAGRGQVYAARYPASVDSPAGWAPEDGYHLLTPAELAERADEPALFCGEWRVETRTALAADLGARARFASSLAIRRAAWLAELALARAGAGLYDDPARIEPLYLRRPAITSSSKVKRKDPGGHEDDLPRGEGG